MRAELSRDYRFEAAHRLPNLPEAHKCRRLHGHSFRIQVVIAGPVAPVTGFVMDFADVDQIVDPVIASLDHYYLNEISGLENPTSEILAAWLWDKIQPALPRLSAVTVAATGDARVTYRGQTE
jgi:6-pyruvoyltetrahydropterin/6-carboxytetrahydropterin synthase